MVPAHRWLQREEQGTSKCPKPQATAEAVANRVEGTAATAKTTMTPTATAATAALPGLLRQPSTHNVKYMLQPEIELQQQRIG